ncbi:unnamed protein product, partial [Choristocarpus tenellus]
MGGYFSSPRTEKVSEEGSNENLTYAASGMQGWRSSMEDSHVAEDADLLKDAAVFAVFDGHGGKTVADF